MTYPYDPLLAGVLFRQDTGVEAYDEAIEALQAAKRQVLSQSRGEAQLGCEICSDSCHTADICHHNPLLMARRAIMAARVWRCYHCDAVFTDAKAAEDHFGKRESEVARCLHPRE